MSVNSKMTAIANATRALDGSTAALTLDGIASKLGVEKTNIDAALAALVEKEVDVPAGSTSAALAELIASIEAGGGNYFTFTPATKGTIVFELERPESLNKILWCALGVLATENDKADSSESVFGCTACTDYSSKGNQKVYTAYSTSETSDSYSFKCYNSSINNMVVSVADSSKRGSAFIKYSNASSATFSFYATESGYGIRVGETYAVCLVYK